MFILVITVYQKLNLHSLKTDTFTVIYGSKGKELFQGVLRKSLLVQRKTIIQHLQLTLSIIVASSHCLFLMSLCIANSIPEQHEG